MPLILRRAGRASSGTACIPRPRLILEPPAAPGPPAAAPPALPTFLSRGPRPAAACRRRNRARFSQIPRFVLQGCQSRGMPARIMQRRQKAAGAGRGRKAPQTARGTAGALFLAVPRPLRAALGLSRSRTICSLLSRSRVCRTRRLAAPQSIVSRMPRLRRGLCSSFAARNRLAREIACSARIRICEITTSYLFASAAGILPGFSFTSSRARGAGASRAGQGRRSHLRSTWPGLPSGRADRLLGQGRRSRPGRMPAAPCRQTRAGRRRTPGPRPGSRGKARAGAAAGMKKGGGRMPPRTDRRSPSKTDAARGRLRWHVHSAPRHAGRHAGDAVLLGRGPHRRGAAGRPRIVSRGRGCLPPPGFGAGPSAPEPEWPDSLPAGGPGRRAHARRRGYRLEGEAEFPPIPTKQPVPEDGFPQLGGIFPP